MPVRSKFLNFSSNSALSLRVALLLFFVSLMIGTFGFMYIEDYTLSESLYMSVITLSTVGFAEVRPLGEAGRLFVSLYILLNVGIFTYAISAFTAYVIQGSFLKQLIDRRMEKTILAMKNHTVICGYGRHGMEMVEHFQKHNHPFVVIDSDAEKLKEHALEEKDPFLYIIGDATQDKVLEKAGVSSAAHLIAALPDDTENLYIVLSARQLSANINIISRFRNPRAESKLRLAGANKVLMPEQIGGFYMATLINKPGAIDFLSFIAQENKDIGLENIAYEKLPRTLQGKSLQQMELQILTGANIISYIHPDGQFEVNPAEGLVMQPDSSFIALGSTAQLEALRRIVASD